MTIDDLTTALEAALRERAATIAPLAPPEGHIRRRVARRQARRRRRNLLSTATLIGLLAVAAAVWGLARPSHHVEVSTGPVVPSTTAKPPNTQGLADTTVTHNCPSIGGAPTLPNTTTTVIGKSGPTSTSAMFPTSIPAGLCLVQTVAGAPAAGQFQVTALASCSTCAHPTAAVAISTSSKRDTWDDGSTAGQQTGLVGGTSYAYEPPATAGARAMMAVPINPQIDSSTGLITGPDFVLIGYGLNKADYLKLATQVLDHSSPLLAGMVTVYDGPADSNDNIVPAGIDAYASLTWTAVDGNAVLTFTYQHSAQTPALTAFAWQYPDAQPGSSTGPPTLVAPVAHGYTIFSEPGPDTLLSLTYGSTAAATAAQLVPILDHLQTVDTTSTAWTTLVAAAQHHQDNENPVLYP